MNIEEQLRFVADAARTAQVAYNTNEKRVALSLAKYARNSLDSIIDQLDMETGK